MVSGDDLPEARRRIQLEHAGAAPSGVWKVTDDGRNVAKASYSRYYEVMYTGEFADVINPNTINTTGLATYRWFGDANGNGIVDTGEFDPVPLSTVQPRLNGSIRTCGIRRTTRSCSPTSASWRPTSGSARLDPALVQRRDRR